MCDNGNRDGSSDLSSSDVTDLILGLKYLEHDKIQFAEK
jgi:hypothetical protein